MNYKNYNDYELIYSVREKDDFAFDIIFEKYQPIIKKFATDFFQRSGQVEELFCAIRYDT